MTLNQGYIAYIQCHLGMIKVHSGVTFTIKVDPPARVACPHEAAEALLVDVAIGALLAEVAKLLMVSE